MGFDKNYPNRKDKRKHYRGAKAVDTSCRNHGSCPWCQGKVKYKVKRQKNYIDDQKLSRYCSSVVEQVTDNH